MYEFRHPTAEKPSGRDLSRLDGDQREAWQERVAICVIDGGLSEAEAEEMAWRQINAQNAHVGARAAGAAEA